MLWTILFWGIPCLLIIMSIKSILDYLKIKKELEKNPDAVNSEQLKKLKTKALVMAIPGIVVTVIIIGFIILLYTAIAYM